MLLLLSLDCINTIHRLALSTIEGLYAAFDKKRNKLAREQRKRRDRHGIDNLTIQPSQQQQDTNIGLKASVNNKGSNRPFFVTINESKTGGVMPDYNSGSQKHVNEYAKYDPEPDADQFLINSGATIISSTIEVNGRIIHRPKDDEYY